MAAKKTRAQSGWTAIRLQNFRLFEDTGVIRYAPVTLLFGKNSSGKTSILRGPLMIKQMLASTARGEPSFVGSDADFGSFIETVYQGDLKRNIVLTAEIISSPGIPYIPEGYSDKLDKELVTLMQRMVVEITLHWNNKASKTQFLRIQFMSMIDGTSLINMTRTGPSKFDVTIAGQSTRKVSGQLNLQSLRSVELFPNRGVDEANFAFDFFAFALGNNLEWNASKLVHIGPLRDQPSRAYQLNQVGVRAVGNTVDVLQTSKTAKQTIDKSLRELGMASSVTLAKLAPGYVAITLADAKTGRKDNLADVGFGVSQVLPILAALATIQEGSTILIEQPELHLHPEAQGRLADVLLNIGKERNLTLVIETHSEHILLRLQRRVAEHKVPDDYVTTYFVDDGQVVKGEIDKFGGLQPGVMPKGFFEEEWLDLLKLTKAAAKHSR